MKYKVGDMVRVRKDLVLGDYYGGICYTDGMNEFKGKECVITNIDTISYQINDYGFWWTDEMLEYVDNEEMFESVDDEKVLEYALEKLGMSKEELANEEEDIRFIDNNFKEKNRYLQYCDKFNSQCEGCKIKKFKDKYKKHVVPNCRDIYRYLKEKGEI